MPFFGVGPPPLCALAVHIGRCAAALAMVQGDRSRRDAPFVRSRCSMPFFGVGPPPLSALAVHIGRLYRSRHLAGRSFKSRRALCALTVLDALLWRRTAAVAVCSRRLHKTLIPLSPSCKVNVQVARRARCALMVLDALLWRQATAAAVLSLSTHRTFIGRLYRSPAIEGNRSSRDALFALTVLEALL